jgi:hypothetical protein
MSAFDEARGSGRAAPASRSGMGRAAESSPRRPVTGGSGGGAGGGAFGSAFDAASSSAAPVGSGGSYQNADRLYTSTCENIERELRKLTSTVAAVRKQVDAVGTAKDTDDTRKKM